MAGIDSRNMRRSENQVLEIFHFTMDLGYFISDV